MLKLHFIKRLSNFAACYFVAANKSTCYNHHSANLLNPHVLFESPNYETNDYYARKDPQH